MRKLYKFYWDCGRDGYLTSIFIADENEVKQAIGHEVSFGEVLGKHSNIYGTLESGDLEDLKISEETIKELEKAIGKTTISGHNPLYYIEYTCSKCEDSYTVGEVDFYLDEENNNILCEYCIDDKDKEKLKQL